MIMVKEIFRTIQGEGLHAGHPAVFVRLAGCPLRCTWCDTDFAGGEALTEEQLAFQVQPLLHPNKLIVITGGEPLAQPIKPLIAAFIGTGAEVQIETSGVVDCELEDPPGDFGDLFAPITVVCSPKTSKLGYTGWVDAWKYVTRAGWIDPDDGLPTMSTQTEGHPKRIARPNNSAPVYLQPCYDADPSVYDANVRATIDACQKFGYRLSLQTHKILGLP